MRVRIGAVQYRHSPAADSSLFFRRVQGHVAVAYDYGCDWLVFPEYLTLELLFCSSPDAPAKTWTAAEVGAVAAYTDDYLTFFQRLAAETGINIVGGTHLATDETNVLHNVAHLFLPDGTVHTQPKVRLTPTERDHWGVAPGREWLVFSTAKGRVAILTCYDIEFPEAARVVAARGAEIILCPSCTDDRAGFHRVRYCAQARAVENQLYVVQSALVGGLPHVRLMEQSVGRAAILSPCDVLFPADGVVAEGEPNADMVVVADVDLELLQKVRAAGSVTTWADWHGSPTG